MLQHDAMTDQPSPVRFNLVRSTKKPFWSWLRECRWALPHKGWNDEKERWEWMRCPVPERWEHEPVMIRPGEPGYDDAAYEVAFLMSEQGFERLVPDDAGQAGPDVIG
jgi:hypothetical protein